MPNRLLCALLCVFLPLSVLAEDFFAPIDLSSPPVEATTGFTPGHERCGKPNCYWETPMDIRTEAAIWAMLTAPITVIDGNFRSQVYLREGPSEDSKAIGDITRASQGVHVLETLDNGWTKIECYSSSFAGSKTKAWNQLLTGYVETETLKEVEVRTEFGLVVDKLTQRLYIFQDGKLFDELAVSTGLGTKADPENETRSGEYILYSATGAFPSEPFLCNYGIRYNDGDLLHEVPHIPREDGSEDYSRTEGKLGQRASHGCIRVQRKRTEKGVNMKWIWNNMYKKMKTRLVIWEDWTGRFVATPAEDTPLYYNPKGGKTYHDSPTCNAVLEKYEPMPAFTYGELETEPYHKLTACEYCIPPRREAEILKINLAHAIKPQ